MVIQWWSTMTKNALYENHNSIFTKYKVTALCYFVFVRPGCFQGSRCFRFMSLFIKFLSILMYKVCFPNFFHRFHVIQVKLGSIQGMMSLHIFREARPKGYKVVPFFWIITLIPVTKRGSGVFITFSDSSSLNSHNLFLDRSTFEKLFMQFIG